MNPWPHRAATVLAAATLVLIFLGGLVTSTHSGLAVPDWPLSYGRLMPPMIGGILFEHGHRLAAASVGCLVILLNLVFWRFEKRGWVRRAALAALDQHGSMAAQDRRLRAVAEAPATYVPEPPKPGRPRRKKGT